ncbi:MAG: orotidine-5'-phosphate decarboxylase [Bacteroidota bacterium]|nr:orotidine-5'-phosphate decarboxylase [Bacteroidota bacterium]
MTRQELSKQIFDKGTYLCVGLDSDINKIPKFLKTEPDPIFSFNKAIIDATIDYCVSYKINTAFYESLGAKGWETMQKTFEYIPSTHFKIADAKRGDIGNTSDQYAKAFFENLNADAITIAPYMGKDSIYPFLKYENKWSIILALTSNNGSIDFQLQKLESGEYVFEKVLSETSKWGNIDNTMYVVGATNSAQFSQIREIIPNHFLLVPGVGAQGGNLQEVSQECLNADGGILVNSSRAIIFASAEKDFAIKAKEESKKISSEMKNLIDLYIK